VYAQGSDPTELSDAKQAITKGASVLIMDPLDAKVGASIESWVTTSNMNSTVIADQFVPAQRLCAGQYAAACQAAGISV
jgi:hypothetical protein